MIDAAKKSAASGNRLLGLWWVRVSLFAVFACAAFYAQGWHPDIIQDHLFYFQNADNIFNYFGDAHPSHGLHQYWRGFSDNLSLSVLLAYLHSVTNDNIVSCKIVLLVTTLLYMCAYYTLTGLYIGDVFWRFVVTILSSFFVSYGPTYWGFTDFQASLSRTLVIPVHVLLIWWYMRHYSSWHRLLVFPIAVYATLIHLSSFHLLGVLITLEAFRLFVLVIKRGHWRRRVVELLLAGLVTGVALFHLANIPVRSSVSQFIPFLCIHPLPPYAGPADGRIRQKGSIRYADLRNVASERFDRHLLPIVNVEVSKSFVSDREVQHLNQREAWKLELSVARWRNFPPPLSTIILICGTSGFIFTMAVAGFVMQERTGRKADGIPYRNFAIATLVFSWGPQLLIFMGRHFLALYPHNIEECRSLMYLNIPLVYFFYQFLIGLGSFARKTILRASAVLLFVMQPIVIVEHSPLPWRLRLFREAKTIGAIDSWESPRTMYAAQMLALEDPSQRFYYSCEDVFEWLKNRVNSSTLVISNRPEMVLSGARIIGSHYNLISLNPREKSTMNELDAELTINKYLEENDRAGLLKLGRQISAKYIVVPGTASNAIYSGRYYSVLELDSPSRQLHF